jgi:hypothetical protein
MAVDYSNPYQSEIVGLDRQRKLAEMLLKQGMDQNNMQGQMVSGRYVGASPWQGIANLAHAYVGKQLGEEADVKQQAIADKLRKLGQEEVYDIMTTAKGRQASEEPIAGPYDLSQGIKAPTIQRPEVKANADLATIMAAGAQTPEGRAFAPALMANALPKEITPYEKEKLRLDEENLKLQRANANRPSFSAIEGTPYAMNSRTGEVVTLKDPATGQPLAAKLPAHLQNELTSINQQKSTINDVLQSVEKNQQAFGPKFGAVGLLPFGDIAQNRKFTEDELKARTKVFNNASAVMKERAGTAMSESEKKIVSRFLPNEFDDAQTIMKKMIGFNEYLDAKARGTIPTAGGVQAYVPNMGGQTAPSTVAAPAAPAAPAKPAEVAPQTAWMGNRKIVVRGNGWVYEDNGQAVQ